MIRTTTQLNTPGPDLAADRQACTPSPTSPASAWPATRWRWRAARAANVHLNWAAVPLLPGVRALAAQGLVTGASGRNWAGYGARSHAAGRLCRTPTRRC